MFGLKQKGKAAVQAINVFHPAVGSRCSLFSLMAIVEAVFTSSSRLHVLLLQTYFGMDVSAVEDPVQRRALETMIKTYGQTPRQLFSGSHVSRVASKVLMEAELPAAMGLLVQLAFRESREQTKEIVCPVMSRLAAGRVLWYRRGIDPCAPPHRALCPGSKV